MIDRTSAEFINYRLALDSLMAAGNQARTAVRQKVAAWETEAQANGVPVATIITTLLQPWNAWDSAVATLVDVTIPTEIIRLQNGGDPGNLAAFQVPSFTLPPVPGPGTVYTAPSTSYVPPVDPYDPIDPVWGSDSKPVPDGYTINYGNLSQLYQQARAAGDVTLANSIAAQINAVTRAGPVEGGFVPIIGTDAQGNAITPPAGVVNTADGVVVAPGSNPGDAWERPAAGSPVDNTPVDATPVNQVPGVALVEPLDPPGTASGTAGVVRPVAGGGGVSTTLASGGSTASTSSATMGGPLSTVSGKVLAVVLALGLIVWLATRKQGA